MDAQEFYHLRSMSGEDWERVRKEYDYWIRNVQLTGARFWIGVTVAGIPTAYFFQGWLKFLGFLMVLMALCESAKRKGNWEGYVDGFAAGRDEGIEKALGFTA